jgi:hypothetical protein
MMALGLSKRTLHLGMASIGAALIGLSTSAQAQTFETGVNVGSTADPNYYWGAVDEGRQ